MEYKDLAGQDMAVGDYIVYSAAAGRAGVMKLGQIVELSERRDTWTNKHAAVVKAVTIDQWRTWSGGLQNKGKPVTLGMFERILVVTKIPALAEVFEKHKQAGLDKLAKD